LQVNDGGKLILLGIDMLFSYARGSGLEKRNRTAAINFAFKEAKVTRNAIDDSDETKFD